MLARLPVPPCLIVVHAPQENEKHRRGNGPVYHGKQARIKKTCDQSAPIRFQPTKARIMPFVEVSTGEKLSGEIRAKLAEEFSNAIMTMSGGMAICEF
jgi:hypothetical protein